MAVVVTNSPSFELHELFVKGLDGLLPAVGNLQVPVAQEVYPYFRELCIKPDISNRHLLPKHSVRQRPIHGLLVSQIRWWRPPCIVALQQPFAKAGRVRPWLDNYRIHTPTRHVTWTPVCTLSTRGCHCVSLTLLLHWNFLVPSEAVH